MEDTARLSQLIGEIYDAALDPALWPDVLRGSAEFVGGVAAALFMKDTIHKHHNTVHTFGYDPEYTREYIEHYVALDPFTIGQLVSRVGDVISLADIVSHEEFRESRFYREWVQPQGWIDALGGTLEKTATCYAAASVIRHERQGVVDREARHRMKLIVPHVRRAVLIGRVLDLHKVEAAAMADTLDGLATAVFLVDSAARVIHANIAGKAMQGAGDVFSATAAKLSAVDPASDQVLRDVFTSAGDGDTAVGAKGVAVPLTALTGERYVAHVLPLTCGAHARPASPIRQPPLCSCARPRSTSPIRWRRWPAPTASRLRSFASS